MSHHDFKKLCQQLKVYPVVVTEESVEKVIKFCATKRSAPGMPTQSSEEGFESALAWQSEPLFDFGDFIKAFKVSGRRVL